MCSILQLGPYSISEGDVVKLGRFKLRVRQLCGYESEELVGPPGDLSLLLPLVR